METINVVSGEEIKLLDVEKTYANSDIEDIKRVGINFRGYVFEITDDDIIRLMVKKKSLILNIDGEYTCILKYKDEEQRTGEKLDDKAI